MFKNISKGKVQISPYRKNIEKPVKHTQLTSEMPLESIEESLKSLRANLKEQRVQIDLLRTKKNSLKRWNSSRQMN